MSKAARQKRIEEAKKSAQASTGSNTGKYIGGIVVAVVAVLIIGVAFFVSRNEDLTPSVAGADPSAAAPKGALSADNVNYPFGWPNGTFDASKPTLAIWEDFQCPGCASYEGFMGPVLKNIADEGAANVVYRPTTFLDRNLGGTSSSLAAGAFGCAIDAGKGLEFHDAVYANQPSEGVGYTTADMTTFATTAGISGAALDTFNTCVADGTYSAWAANSTKAFYDAEVPGTPFVTLNGVELPQEIATNEQLLRAEIQSVAAGNPVTSGTETPVSVPSSTAPASPAPSDGATP